MAAATAVGTIIRVVLERNNGLNSPLGKGWQREDVPGVNRGRETVSHGDPADHSGVRSDLPLKRLAQISFFLDYVHKSRT